MQNLSRTLFVSFGLLAGSASLAAANTSYVETVVHDTTTPVEIALNTNTVLCSAADYGALYLKVGMPELAKLTLLDHQNIGANAPCVAAGMCKQGNMPQDIIDPANPTETVQINVKALRADMSDDVAHTCETMLVERVHVNIRGVDFTHERTASLGSRKFEDCAQEQPVTGTGSGSGSGKADGEATVDSQAPAAGCSAAPGGAGGAGMLAMFVAGVLGRRRRRR